MGRADERPTSAEWRQIAVGGVMWGAIMWFLSSAMRFFDGRPILSQATRWVPIWLATGLVLSWVRWRLHRRPRESQGDG